MYWKLWVGLATFLLIATGVVARQHVSANSPVLAVRQNSDASVAPPHLGYGFNVADLDQSKLEEMGFDWIKVFGPPGHRMQLNVLQRVDANVQTLQDLGRFSAEMQNLAQVYGGNIEAYEIGNEPNLDASYGWYASPNADDYVTVLCTAYDAIKAHDDDSVVVSAGLAPVGRVTGNWHGLKGHNGLFQDEREWFIQFLDAGGAECADVFGYHPYGYRADFDAEPDVYSDDPNERCVNGFCFRGVEKIYDIMVARGVADKQVWATEWGWIIEPPQHCLNSPTWSGRQWQVISAEKQAENLAGAFQYADANWPWMGPMFVFNLNFNTAGHYDECEQMRFYGVEDRPAEAALRNMPKRYASSVVPLTVAWDGVTATYDRTQLPLQIEVEFDILNGSSVASNYAVSVSETDLSIRFTSTSGTIAAGGRAVNVATIDVPNLAAGFYSAEITITGDVGEPSRIPIDVTIEDALSVTPLGFGVMRQTGVAAGELKVRVAVENSGVENTTYDTQYVAQPELDLTVARPSGVVGAGRSADLGVTLTIPNLPAGRYGAQLSIVSPASESITVPLTVIVADEISTIFLPTIRH